MDIIFFLFFLCICLSVVFTATIGFVVMALLLREISGIFRKKRKVHNILTDFMPASGRVS